MQPLSPISPQSATPAHAPETPQPPENKTDEVDDSMPPQQLQPVSLSQPAQEISHYTEAMVELPDLREERITEIQQAIETGTYSISAEDLADKLIQNISAPPPSTS